MAEQVTVQYLKDSTLNIAIEINTIGLPDNSVNVGDDAFLLRS